MRIFLSSLACASALLLLTSDAIGQQFMPPSGRDMSRYVPGSVLHQAPLEGEAKLSLSDAIALGLRFNLNVEVERYAPIVAQQVSEGAWGAYDPTLSADTSYFLRVNVDPGRCGLRRPVLPRGRIRTRNVTGRVGRIRRVISCDLGVSALKTLAPESESAEIKIHPIGCPERRSSIHIGRTRIVPTSDTVLPRLRSWEMPVQREMSPGSDDGRAAPRQPGQDPFRPENVHGM